MSLKITNLSAKVEESQQVLKGVNLQINPGEVHVLMGPNGSGKSSLAKLLMGHPDYQVESGEISINAENLLELEPNERAKAGLFLANQYPTEVPGVNLANFLRLTYNSLKPETEKLSMFKFRQLLKKKLAEADLPKSFMERNLNEGFSGGEKKKCEILQMLLFEPKYVILDETDSGLDVDAIKSVFSNLAAAIHKYQEMGILLITHYHRVFDYITPDYVHLFLDGKIKETGDLELAKRIDYAGYKSK